MQRTIISKEAIGLFLLVFCMATATAARFQGRGQLTTAPEQKELNVSQFPLVDYTASKPTDPKERAKREAKSKKYNSPDAPRITESTDQIYSIVDWEVGLPALPVARSSAVIIGEITEAQAYLSDDQAAIYSEFAVRTEVIVKNDSLAPLAAGSSVIVERSGGRVRLPSGKVAASIVNQQDMPRVGGRYVLFLTHEFLMGGTYDQNLFILTGYELRGDRVFPLDKTLPGHPITAYKGKDETLFLQDLWTAVSNASPTIQSNKAGRQ